MTEQRFDDLEQRVGTLEAQTKGLEAKLARLEPRTIPAPPVQVAPPKFDVPKWAVEGAPAPIPIREAHAPPKDAEYQFGAQWLPRIGATLLILGIAYLIGLGVTKGWITPVMLFASAVILCLGFIVGGLFLRDEREDFGQVLMGIGSCGMFATLAGGHVYQNLYSGETLVTAFIFWSLANLAYALWRRSRTFLAIGVIGGFIASAMPISKDAYTLSLILHAVILFASAAVMIRHKFAYAAIGLWVASGLALFPIIIETDLPWNLRVAAIYGSSFTCLIAYLFSRSESKPAEDKSAVGFIIGVAALIAFGVQQGVDGTLHTLIAAGVCALLALGFRRDSAVRDAFAWTGLAIATLVAPFGLEPGSAVFLLSGLTVLSGATAILTKRDEANNLAILQLCAAGGAYLWGLVDRGFPTQEYESLALASILVGGIVSALGIGKREEDPRLLVIFLGVWAVATKLGSILIALPGDMKLASFGVTATWIILGVSLLAAGFIAALRNYRYAGLTVLLCAVGKVLVVDLATATPELRVTVLIGVGLALVGGGYAYVRKRGLVG